MNLHPCLRCGSTLTAAFRFCPGCGLPSDGVVSTVEQRRRPRPARRVTWSAALGRPAGHARGALARATSSVSPFQRRLRVRARLLVAAAREAARLLVEVVVVGAASLREAFRSAVLLHRLQARRAALIYDAGCAALSGDTSRVEPARAELRVLDELIGAVARQTSGGVRAGDRAPVG